MALKSIFCSCSCYFTNQIFLRNLRIHVRYLGKSEFIDEYGEFLKRQYNLTRDGIDNLIEEIESEVNRRISHEVKSLERRIIIFNRYKPLHSNLYHIQDSFFTEEFLALVDYSKSVNCDKTGLLKLLKVEKGDEIYSFSVFNQQFCERFIEELRHFEKSDLPKGRPNTMNQSGYLLDELGFYDDFITPLRTEYLQPVCNLLYPQLSASQGLGLDSHKAFIVRYTMQGSDQSLSYHYDNAEITINICLGDTFQDGHLYLGPMRTDNNPDPRFSEYAHVIGRGVLHRGQQMHGAEPITDGERYNMIIWMRSSSIRNHLCPMCNVAPKLIESKTFGDGFTKTIQENTGWCSSS